MTSKRADPPDGSYGDGATSWGFRQQGREAKPELDGEDYVYLLLIEGIIQV